MDMQELSLLFHTDFNIDSITSAHRSWNAETRYNWMEIPRTRHGLMLLTDYPAVFQLPDGSSQQGNPGEVFLLPKGARYAVGFSVPKNLWTHPVVINFRLTDLQGAELSFGDKILKLCADDGTLTPLFLATEELYKQAAPVLLKAKVYELFGTLFPITQKDECCIQYINRHYTENFSIPYLAQRSAMSEAVYRKKFKQITGKSPIRYINHLKIEKACQLILSCDLGMQEISDFLNFYNLPYFYKVFRDVTGLTPMQYRTEKGEKL